MPLTTEQEQTLRELDRIAKQIVYHGGEDALLMSLYDKMDRIKAIMDALSQHELDQYCQRYTGFYNYMDLLERLAVGMSEGIFDDIL